MIITKIPARSPASYLIPGLVFCSRMRNVPVVRWYQARPSVSCCELSPAWHGYFYPGPPWRTGGLSLQSDLALIPDFLGLNWSKLWRRDAQDKTMNMMVSIHYPLIKGTGDWEMPVMPSWTQLRSCVVWAWSRAGSCYCSRSGPACCDLWLRQGGPRRGQSYQSPHQPSSYCTLPAHHPDLKLIRNT